MARSKSTRAPAEPAAKRRTGTSTGGPTRRERVEAMQAEQRRKERRIRLIAAVAVLVAFVGVVVLVQSQRGRIDQTAPRPAGVTEAAGGIALGAPVGSGKPLVELYEDFSCPHCRDLEATIGPTLHELIDAKSATVMYRPIAILGDDSVRAGAASGCAQTGGQFLAYHDTLYANQPAEGSGGFSVDRLIEFGGQVGLTDARFTQCVTDQTYRRWVQDATVAASQRGVHGTPTVFVNGAELALVPGDPNAVTMLRDAVAKPAG